MGTETAVDGAAVGGETALPRAAREGTQMSTAAPRQQRPRCKCSRPLKLFQVSDNEAIRMCDSDTCLQFLRTPLSSSVVTRPSSQVLVGRRASRSESSSRLTAGSASSSSSKSLSGSVPLPPAARPDITRSWVAQHNPRRGSTTSSLGRPSTFSPETSGHDATTAVPAAQTPVLPGNCVRTEGQQRGVAAGASERRPSHPPKQSSAASAAAPQLLQKSSKTSSSPCASRSDSVQATACSSGTGPSSGSVSGLPVSDRQAVLGPPGLVLIGTGLWSGSGSAGSVSAPSGLSGSPAGAVAASKASGLQRLSVLSSKSRTNGETLPVNGTGVASSAAPVNSSQPPSGVLSISQLLSQGLSRQQPAARGRTSSKSRRPRSRGAAQQLARCAGSGPAVAEPPRSEPALPRLPELTPHTVLPLHQSPLAQENSTPEPSSQASSRPSSRPSNRRGARTCHRNTSQLASGPAPALPNPPPLPTPPPLSTPPSGQQLPNWTPVGPYRSSRWPVRTKAPPPPTRAPAPSAPLRGASGLAESTSAQHSPGRGVVPVSQDRWKPSPKVSDLLLECVWQRKTAKDFAPYPLKGACWADQELDKESSAASSRQPSPSPTPSQYSSGSAGSRATTASSSGSSGSRDSSSSKGSKRRGASKARTSAAKRRKQLGGSEGTTVLLQAPGEVGGASAELPVAPAPQTPAAAADPSAAGSLGEQQDLGFLQELAPSTAAQFDFDVDEFIRQTAALC